eukprot:EG_transcript_8384
MENHKLHINDVKGAVKPMWMTESPSRKWNTRVNYVKDGHVRSRFHGATNAASTSTQSLSQVSLSVIVSCTGFMASTFFAWNMRRANGVAAQQPMHSRGFPVLRAQATDDPGASALDGGAALELRNQLARLDEEWRSRPGGDISWLEIEGSYVLMPPIVPWGVIHFIGGAVLGSYPHVVYNELFMRVCRTAGVAVIATPYDLGLDHRQLAADAGAAFRKALEACQGRYSWSPQMPVFALGHSLGAKLQLLRNCAGAERGRTPPARQLGLLAYNNYDLTDSVKMLETFLRSFNQFRRPGGVDTAVLQGLFKVVETFTAAIGLQFTPSQAELRSQVKEGHDRKLPITCFKFQTDSLDCSQTLAEDLGSDVCELAGDHLTPVYLKLGLDGKAGAGLPAYEAFAATSWQVGNEAQLQALADAIVEWLRGNTPQSTAAAYRILPNGVIDV